MSLDKTNHRRNGVLRQVKRWIAGGIVDTVFQVETERATTCGSEATQ